MIVLSIVGLLVGMFLTILGLSVTVYTIVKQVVDPLTAFVVWSAVASTGITILFFTIRALGGS